MAKPSINIIGAGLAGALLAILLARRGFAVSVYERRRDPRRFAAESGRSINLALATRGIRALKHAGLMHRVQPLLIPMRGRMVHEPSGASALQPYGVRDTEVIHSVSRPALNLALIEEAARLPDVSLHFEQTCTGIDAAREELLLQEGTSVPLELTIATDGAGSAVRTSLAQAGLVREREDPLDHDYKELTIAPRPDGTHALEPYALHIWPRRGFMLIALPNTDGSFTATLFLPRVGDPSFAQLRDGGYVRQFFQRHFPDACELMPELLEEFEANPQGRLGTVFTVPWHLDGRVLLIGDAAHAIVPFHGQGMNIAFEDCLELTRLIDDVVGPLQQRSSEVTCDDWSEIFAGLERKRRPDAEAIARMSLENSHEMRDAVLDDKYIRHKRLAMQLERLFPDRFIPRYSMVMFHPEIGYAEALRRGQIQTEILEILDGQASSHGSRELPSSMEDSPADVAPESSSVDGALDLTAARRLIEARLPPLNPQSTQLDE